MTFDSNQSLQSRLAPLQLIGACLIAGVVVFSAIAMSIGPITASGPGTGSGGTLDTVVLLRGIWGVMFLSQMPLIFIFRGIMLKRAAALRRGDKNLVNAPSAHEYTDSPIHVPTFELFRTSSIIRLALAESVAILGAVAVLFSADAIDLLLVALPLIAMLMVFPTTPRWRAFDRQTAEMAATSF